jgi:PAS domain S-box-containing protein
MQFYFDKRVMIGFGITVLVLLILGIFSYSSTQRLMDSAGLESHATRVITTAEQVVKAVIDMETGQRGFLITGNEDFLQPFYKATRTIAPHLNTLDSSTTENIHQQIKIDSLRRMINVQTKWTRHVIDVRRSSFEEAQALVITGEGKRNTDIIRKIIRGIQEEEMNVFNTRNTITNQSVQQFQYSFIAFVAVMIIIIFYLFYAVNSTLKARNQAEAELLRVARETKDLYDNAPIGYHSLDENGKFVEINQTELSWLGYSREEIIYKLSFNDILTEKSQQIFRHSFSEFKQTGEVHDLEFELIRKDGGTFPVILNSTAITTPDGKYSKSRSTVIDNTERKKAQTRILDLNRELEGFTYSVSHDLRAPLRSITGYATILKEEYYPKMDDEAKRITDVIIRNTARMGQLIDDLLDFSRLGRKPVSLASINMKEMVENIVREQTASLKDRNFAIHVLDVEPAKGDVAMIRQVWINLISNAIKYTSGKDVSQIEIGSFKQEGRKVYYISDNGAGFDMKYGDKLFGVFQRLHKMNEFEGTGVGLALVKTIIKRHGGDVWAEGKVQEGAKFYFSLT